MAPLSDLSPGNAYDLLMWLAMPVFLSGVILAGRLAGGASWLASVAALLLLPIAVEANFFNNDNLIAGGLSLWTMAVLLGRRGMAFAVLAGRSIFPGRAVPARPGPAGAVLSPCWRSCLRRRSVGR